MAECNVATAPYLTTEGEWEPVTFKEEPCLYLTMGGATAANVALYAGAFAGNTACRAYVVSCAVIYALAGAWIAADTIRNRISERKQKTESR